MRTFLKRVPYRRSVVCACGHPIGNDRAAKKLKRCAVCVERFAKGTQLPPPWWQGDLFGADRRPSQKKSAPPAPAPVIQLPPPPPAPPKPTAVQLTKERARRLEGARIRADADARLSMYLDLRAAGVPRSDAEERVDAAFSHGSNHDD